MTIVVAWLVLWVLLFAPFFGCCCCPSHVCVHLLNCDSTAHAGQSVEITGPGGFDETVTTDADGSACVEVSATGTYTATYGAYSVNIVVGDVCAFYSGTICPDSKGTLRLKLVNECNVPLAGLDFVLTKGGTTLDETTDSGGLWTGCIAAGVWTVSIPSPPCPYADFSTHPSVSVTACVVSALRTLTVPLQGGFTCHCGTVPVPFDGYTVTTPCGAVTLDLSAGSEACLGVSTPDIAYAYIKHCVYITEMNLEFVPGTTGMSFDRLTCGPDGNWTVRVTWPVQAWENCDPDLWIYGYAPYDGTNCWDFTATPYGPGITPFPGSSPFGGVYAYNVTTFVPLTGTVTGTLVSLSGTLGDVFLPPGLGLGFPGMYVSPPCPGTITVTRDFCP